MIRIDDNSQVPIYQQIIEAIHHSILAGIYKPDHRLPSIRELAVKLKVNPNTIAKAYQEMSNEGLIYFKRGQGAYVSPKSSDELIQEAEMQITKRIQELVETAESMGISNSQLSKLFNSILEQSHPTISKNNQEVK